MVQLKNSTNVQLCTEEDLDDFVDYVTSEDPNPAITDDYSVLGYDPTPADYIRRCRTVEEAIEILEYLKKQGDITKKEYKKLLDKLKNEGLTGFGTIKDIGFYGKDFLK